MQNLLKDLGYDDIYSTNEEKGDTLLPSSPILVYSSYEKIQLKNMSKLFPEYSKAINHAIDRLTDLEKVIRECGISHVKFQGRSSIKFVLPALVPKFSNKYDELAINHGGIATVIYAKMMKSTKSDVIDGLTVDEIKKSLLEYCKLDTLALVEIHHALKKMV